MQTLAGLLYTFHQGLLEPKAGFVLPVHKAQSFLVLNTTKSSWGYALSSAADLSRSPNLTGPKDCQNHARSCQATPSAADLWDLHEAQPSWS